MTKHLPPIPPESVSPKGPGGETHTEVQNATSGAVKRAQHEMNHAQQGQQANTKQNTTHQGMQQDR
jgi:hypothetical protein